ncbi:MAG: respiratory nitrate reductase subunit gamma, partial [Deltaproteobacteria bacterium]|nr:respiratory nitrate reductase subunit gamma [Deltaproteobacteria bacterium]
MGLFLFTYFCFVVFVAAVGVQVYMQWRLPLHLRWELYPVKHERGKKAEYGGSYMEEVDWWKKDRKRSLLNEVKYMIPEILLLRGLWLENRKLWQISFPFHFGLYAMMGTFALLLLGAIGMIFGASIVPGKGGMSALIYYLTILLGFIGLTMGTIGAAGLLYRRFTDPALRNYSTAEDYFNLLFILVFFVV